MADGKIKLKIKEALETFQKSITKVRCYFSKYRLIQYLIESICKTIKKI